MSLFPDVQRRAREEIDSTIAYKRLVDLDDRTSLPYVEALFREVMRWGPVLPLSVSHSSISEDTYKNYYIPKGL